jgi:hypothetical protein
MKVGEAPLLLLPDAGGEEALVTRGTVGAELRRTMELAPPASGETIERGRGVWIDATAS